jgi:hypothetical protein
MKYSPPFFTRTAKSLVPAGRVTCLSCWIVVTLLAHPERRLR